MMGLESFFPIIGGHEGAGVDRGRRTRGALGEGRRPRVGQLRAVVRRCRYCTTGRGNLCDAGAGTLGGGMITDGTHRHFVDGKPVTLLAKLGTFAELTCVSEKSVIKVDDDLPLECVALVSCGVATGWGSATRARRRRTPATPSSSSASAASASTPCRAPRWPARSRVIAVDPLEFKREKAMEFGATHTYASMEEAIPEVTEMTWGQMADKVIMTPGVLYGDMMALEAQTLAGKGGTMVVTAVAPIDQNEASVNLFELAMWNKEIKGTIFGSLNPRADIPRLLGMYRDGTLKLDELITERYSLDQINEGYQAMRDGTNIRGVIVYDD